MLRASRIALLITILAVSVALFHVQTVFAADERSTDLKIYTTSPVQFNDSFALFAKSLKNGATIAVGDLDGDGMPSIIVGNGPGGEPKVRVFTVDGTLQTQFLAYSTGVRGGVKVASCDLDNDGKAEIITGTGEKSSPQVRTFDGAGNPVFTPGFYAFSKSSRGGVNVACGDVTGGGKKDIVVGSGIGALPKVKVFDRYGNDKDLDITPYAARDKGGVSVAIGNVDGGKSSEIITGIYRFGRSRVKVYRANAARTVLAEFEGWPESVQGGFNIAAGDFNNDKRDDIAVSIASGDKPQVRLFSGLGTPLTTAFTVFEKDFTGGVNVAAGDLNADGKAELLVAPGKYTVQGNTLYRKYIEVRLDEQRLYAYEKGKVIKTFLISSGIKKYPTPPGTYTVNAKIAKKDYEWSYGENNPDNYDIKDVPWNLRFAEHLYLHDAFWHNNFGHVMSHGCININLVNSKWLYNWADVGTPVMVNGPQPFTTT